MQAGKLKKVKTKLDGIGWIENSSEVTYDPGRRAESTAKTKWINENTKIKINQWKNCTSKRRGKSKR